MSTEHAMNPLDEAALARLRERFFCETGQHWVRELANYGGEVGEAMGSMSDAASNTEEGA